MIYKCLNDRSLLVCNTNSWQFALENDIIPSVLLLSAWEEQEICLEHYEKIIHFFLSKKCCYFVCVGYFSEKLHDMIDDIMYKYDDIHEIERVIPVITTYHVDESIRDSIYFFINLTNISELENECLVALLDVNNVSNQEIIDYLMFSCS